MRKLPTIEELDKIALNNGKGFTRELLVSWGVPWPPKAGWCKALRSEILEGMGSSIINSPPPKKDKPRRPNGKKDRETRKADRLSSPKPKKAYAPSPNNKNSPKSFYASWEWRTLRMEVLKAHGSVCQCCGSRPGEETIGGGTVRIVVDHIKPLSKYWNLRLDRNNLQVLCDECNQGKGAWDETDHRPGVDEVPEGNIILGDSWDEFEEQAEKLRYN